MPKELLAKLNQCLTITKQSEMEAIAVSNPQCVQF